VFGFCRDFIQVLLPDREMPDFRPLAKRERVTVGEWVRRALREARAGRPSVEPETKSKAVRRAAEYSFPTAGVKRMLSEIEEIEAGVRGLIFVDSQYSDVPDWSRASA